VKEKLLITGSTGLVGSYLLKTDLHNYDIFTLAHRDSTSSGIGSFVVDLSASLDTFEHIISKEKPDTIVHLAALSDVDACEIQRDSADIINHLSVRKLAEYIRENPDCFVLYVSTDYVFDGEKGNYREQDHPSPINWYGKTKLLGELELISNPRVENWCIARTSTVFGVHNRKQNLPLYVIEALRNKQKIKVSIDQITSPTYVANLAKMLHEIIERRIGGIIHTCGKSQISRFEQAIKVANAFKLDSTLIQQVSMKDMNWKAQRPRNSSLSVEKANSVLNIKPMSFDEGLSQLFKNLNSN